MIIEYYQLGNISKKLIYINHIKESDILMIKSIKVNSKIKMNFI